MIRRLISAAAGASEAVLDALPGLPADLAQARVLDETANRPWPLPGEPWVMAQTWRDLLFAHWSLAPDTIQPLLPGELPVDTFDGHAWIGITPFEVSGLRPRGLPPAPVGSRFPELNVRTYTTLDGKPGIYFLSLDAASRLAVFGARRTYRLPYAVADMAILRSPAGVRYISRRTAQDMPAAVFEASYAAAGDAYRAKPGSLDYFLTERYCLYTVDARGAPLRAEIQHPPWPLQAARATISRNSMTRPWGVELPPELPVLHFSGLQNVLIWPLRPAR